MPTFQEMMAGAKDEARKLGACPTATQDQAANDANEQRAVAQADYKPADTEQRCGNPATAELGTSSVPQPGSAIAGKHNELHLTRSPLYRLRYNRLTRFLQKVRRTATLRVWWYAYRRLEPRRVPRREG